MLNRKTENDDDDSNLIAYSNLPECDWRDPRPLAAIIAASVRSSGVIRRFDRSSERQTIRRVYRDSLYTRI